MILAVSDKIIACVDLLSQADRQIGDGDHGFGMARGFEGVRELLSSKSFDDATDLLKAVGDTLIDRMGGASGIVFGLMFRAGARGQAPMGYLTPAGLAEYFERSIAEIMKRGGAQPGDKTMLDALVPAAAAMKETAAKGGDAIAALAAAARAAEAGKERSRQFVARFGKAATMGERSLGYPDAGALSVTLIFQALHEWVAANSPPLSPNSIHLTFKGASTMAQAMTNDELRAHNKTRKLYQIAFVTKDLEKAMQSWIDNLKIGPWTVLTFTEKSVKNLKVDAKPVAEPFKFLIAISWIGEMQLEIIQPVYGPTIYNDFLERRGEGLHHIKEQVHDDQIQHVLAEYREKGIGIMQTGQFDIDVHYYLHTEPKLDFIYELGNCPMLDLPPDMIEIYPPEAK